MKRFLSRLSAVLLGISLLLAGFPVVGAELRYDYPADEDPIESPSAILLYMGVKSEQDVYLYEKDADKPYEPGALMRVAMVGYAMQLIEEKQLDMDTVTGTYTLELFNHYVAGTGLHVALMNFVETWKLCDLLTLCTIQTAADCAVTLAATLSGSPEAFVEGMNVYAQQLGCTNSHFTNVMGLNEDGQYMSARDVAVFSRAAMQHTELRNALELTQYTVTPVSGGKTRSWPTSCDFIRQSSEAFYTYALGGKTGGTLSEMSLMGFGGNNGYEYMAVVMGAPRKNDKGNTTDIAYADARRLIRWGLLDFRYETLARKSEPVGRIKVRDSAERNSVTLVPVGDLATVLGESVSREDITRRVVTAQEECVAPVEAGQVLGTLELYLGDELVGSVPVAAAESASRSFVYAAWCDVRDFLFSGWTLAILIILILAVAGYVVLNIRYNRKRSRKWRS
ncbi:MAG: D-alanyl-D-alanine carboxypeptidase [Clostridia bacterium]|nr:D-alanyl-D-alanine carboxypeptidase [Clostridia bacterium]